MNSLSLNDKEIERLNTLFSDKKSIDIVSNMLMKIKEESRQLALDHLEFDAIDKSNFNWASVSFAVRSVLDELAAQKQTVVGCIKTDFIKALYINVRQAEFKQWLFDMCNDETMSNKLSVQAFEYTKSVVENNTEIVALLE